MALAFKDMPTLYLNLPDHDSLKNYRKIVCKKNVIYSNFQTTISTARKRQYPLKDKKG